MAVTKWNRLTVVGCGLIGASFAMGIKRSGATARVSGWDANAEVLDDALRKGIIDEVDTAFASGAVSQSDLIYLATPVNAIIDFLEKHSRQIMPHAIVTDAGSTKVEICRAARKHLTLNCYFFGGHPIAGSHLTSAAHARAELFEGRPYVIVTDDDGVSMDAFAILRKTIELLGASVFPMTAADHDRALALVSHLPQLLSSALAATVLDQADCEELLGLAGPGYQDMTRLAASSWSIWKEIFATNSTPIGDALENLIAKLNLVRDDLRGGHTLGALRTIFEQSQSAEPTQLYPKSFQPSARS